MPIGVGDELGDYEVARLLGRGACGEVFLVRGPGRSRFAMKVIPCDVGPGGAAARARQAAMTEAKLLQGLRHPHIVSCEQVLFEPERQVVRLVLEYMDGGDLQGLIARRRDVEAPEPFEAHFARRVLAAVGGALSHVHAAGVLHRDVKPANVLLARRSQRIKLGDFGVAKLVEAATLKAQTLVGTPYYFSPELVSGDEYGPASDCWALGAVLYEVAMLKRPFEAANQLALIRKICEDTPQPLPAETAEDVKASIEGLLQKAPAQRMTLAIALAVSASVSALVVDGLEGGGGGAEETSDDGEEASPTADGAGRLMGSLMQSAEGDDSWAGVPALQTQEATLRAPPGCAVARARAVLSSDVDDPEDLQLALAELEREGAEDRDATRRDGVEDADAAARDSLGQELRVRLAALREEAAALLDGLLLRTSSNSGVEKASAGVDEEAPPQAEPGSPAIGAVAEEMGGSSPSTPRGATSDAEEKIEVATSLGVDTGAAEEQLASLRKMVGVRVVWGGAVRFFLLPMRSTFEILMRQVCQRFGLQSTAPLQLCLAEVSETFVLDGQGTWDECLQRRGLMEKPGRIELLIVGQPPVRRRRRVRTAAPLPGSGPPSRGGARATTSASGGVGGSQSPSAASGVEATPHGFVVTGTQAVVASVAACNSRGRKALRSGGSMELLPPSGPDAGPSMVLAGPLGPPPQPLRSGGRAVARRQHKPVDAKRTATGKAWAMATGREQPVRWAPTPGGNPYSSSRSSPGAGSPTPLIEVTASGFGLCPRTTTGGGGGGAFGALHRPHDGAR